MEQVHPTSLVDPKDLKNLTKFLAPESMRGSGGILVSASGNRFANELTTRAVLTEAVFRSGTPIAGEEEAGGAAPTVAYLLLNQEAADAFGTGVLGFYMSEFFSVYFFSLSIAGIFSEFASLGTFGKSYTCLEKFVVQYIQNIHLRPGGEQFALVTAIGCICARCILVGDDFHCHPVVPWKTLEMPHQHSVNPTR